MDEDIHAHQEKRGAIGKAVIEFRDFSFQYFSQAAPTLYDINLSLYEGEKVLIVGPSGSGKSTLGHCLNGLIPFSYQGSLSGSLMVNGTETKSLDVFRLSKAVGTVLQDVDGQFVGLTAAEDIAFVLENDNLPCDAMRRRVREVAAMVDMQERLGNSPFELSGGQKQRTSLAGVLVNEVDILLFDEPLANLDPATGRTAIEIIEGIFEQTGKTVVIIEHRLEEVLHRRVDRIIALYDGRIVADMDADHMISSSILSDIGIREPLYVSALKYAGVEVTPAMRPARIQTLNIASHENRLRQWSGSVAAGKKRAARPPLLKIDNLSFSYYGNGNNLDRASFEIQEGEMVSIVGKNGAGKSTLAKILCGLEKEDEGEILFDGKSLREKSIKERAEIIGFVMQNPNQMISKPMIYDEVALGLRLREVAEEEIEIRVKKVLKVCGLLPFVKWPVAALSYGQRKRVTIASILVLDPKIVILDEPTAGQDFRHYTEMMKFLVGLNRLGITVILITHDMHLMLEYTPRSIVLADGKIVADKPASEILTDERIITKANLKETSLFRLAQMAGAGDETAFVQSFIDYERERRRA